MRIYKKFLYWLAVAFDAEAHPETKKIAHELHELTRIT